MIYADTDFLLALIKEEDWLSDKAEKVYRERKDEIWTSEVTMMELMMVSYRNDRNVLKTVAEAGRLIEVREDYDSVKKAAIHVTEDGLTPLDAMHLAKSGSSNILSSDKDFDEFGRVELENY